MENEHDRADAGRDGRICLARLHYQARKGTGKKHFPCSADHSKQDWQPSSSDTYSAMSDDYTYIHRYIHTYIHNPNRAIWGILYPSPRRHFPDLRRVPEGIFMRIPVVFKRGGEGGG